MSTDQGFNTTYFWLGELLSGENVEYQFNWNWDWTLQVTDGVITDFDFEIAGGNYTDSLAKIMSVDVASVNIRYEDGTWWRMGSTKQGVPFGNATSLGVVDWGQKQKEKVGGAEQLNNSSFLELGG